MGHESEGKQKVLTAVQKFWRVRKRRIILPSRREHRLLVLSAPGTRTAAVNHLKRAKDKTRHKDHLPSNICSIIMSKKQKCHGWNYGAAKQYHSSTLINTAIKRVIWQVNFSIMVSRCNNEIPVRINLIGTKLSLGSLYYLFRGKCIILAC